MVLRYRYNQDFRSIYAMVPAVIPLLLVFLYSCHSDGLGVVREKNSVPSPICMSPPSPV